MDVLYDDLENYDDVEALNRLKTENSDLKHKLECCNAAMQKLQTDFDKLEAEFKRLESNYSSLLKISRAEIQRKTDMITNLNIEKDLLIIKAVQNGPAHKVQDLIRNVREETELKRKKKTQNKVVAPKGREEFIRRKSSRPHSPTTSSTATDNSYKMIGNEIVADNNKSSRMDTQENELQKHEVFPVDQPLSPVADKRVSALSRPHLAKLSSDEEFEDMYSALKPKASRESEKTRKRGRDDSQDGKILYNSSHDRPLNYPDLSRERFNRNRAGRFSDTERITREKQHSEPDRNINRGKHHFDRYRNFNDLQHNRFSPERHRRGAKELGDSRYRNRRLESPPRERYHLESPPRERLRLGSPPQERQALRKRIGERRKSYHGRTGNNPEIHSVIHNIHGEYEEPQNKRPRIEPYPVPQEEKRPNEEQYHNESQPPNMGSRTCRSPVFSHTEESSNEPATAQTETRSTTSSVFEDPRLSSDRYVKCSEGTKHISQSANANEIYLQPVDKSLWDFEEVQVPKALRSKPLEISEELVDKIIIDKPLSSISMESGEIRSDTETPLDIYDFQEFNKQIGNSVPDINESQKAKIKPYNEKSPVDNNMLDDIGKRSDTIIKGTKTTKLKVAKKEKANNHKAAETMMSTSKDSHKVDTTMHCDNIKLPSVLHKLIHSMNEERPDGDNSVKNSKVEKEPKRIAASRISNKSEKSKAKTKNDRENQNESNLKTDKNKADKLEKGSEKEPKRNAAYRIPNKSDKSGSKTRDDRDNRNESDLETDNNKTNKLENGPEKEPKLIAAYRIPNKSDKSGSRTRNDRENQNESDLETDNNKTDKLGKGSEKEPKQIAAYRIPKKSEKSGSKTRGDRKNQNESDLETDNNKTDKPEKLSDKEPKRITELELSGKTEKVRLKTTDKNVPEVKETDNLEKVTERDTEKKIKRIVESKASDRNEKASLKTNEIEHKNVSDMKVKEKPVKETENNVSVFREFEHRVYSRHIVEGDLELSDESNDEAQLELEDKIEEKKKISSKSKSHREASKDKSVNSEETTRKTRSQKDREKERKSINKFSELFGDSSSLITPEDLNLATRTAHGLPADCCPPAAEEAQDAIIEHESPVKAQTTEMYPKDFKESLAKSTVVDDKFKIKDRTRTKHKQNKDDYTEQVSDVRTQVVTITESCSMSEGNLMPNTSNYTNQKEVSKLNEKVKESSKSYKRPKTKGEKKLSVSEHTKEINTNNFYISEQNSNNSPTMSDNKENSSSNGNSERNISNEMARIFENPIVSSKISSINASETNKERPQLNDSTKETNCSSGVQDVPNLAPVVEEPGLVTTVVISTGVQPLDSNSAQYVTPFSALASSTPAKDLSAINISSEIESNVSHSAQVSVTISRDDSGSQSEDVPDMRITCYRRRRRVLKR